MLSIETKTPKKLNKLLLLAMFSFGLGIISFGIIFFWFDDNFPSYGSLSYFDRYISRKVNNEKFGIYIEPGLVLPDDFTIANFLETYPNFEIKEKQFADIVLTTEELKTVQTLQILDPNTELILRKVFVPITKFGTLERSITEEDLENIIIFEDNVLDYSSALAKPDSFSCEDVKKKVNEEDSIALVFLDCVDSSVSVLAVDDVSIFGKVLEGNRTQDFSEEFSSDNYKAKYDIWLNYGSDDKTKEAVAYIRNFFINEVDSIADTNALVMTGVTAMGRGVSWKIAKYGPIYPIEKVAEVLQDADIAHTSNEVSFVPGCEQESHTMSFCALPQSIDTLTYAGIDVVELTGNHNNDKGWQYNLDSMNLYEEKGITYVGGGKNLDDAYTVRYSDLGEYKVAWIGFNEAGPAYAWAAEGRPGAAEYWEDKLVELSKEAAENSDIAIMVFQWANENYSYPTEFQKKTARLAIDNGIDLVVGSQGHGTLKMEFYNGSPIYYGLGNFLFDQMFSDKVREGMILRVNTIDGEIKNLEMLPYVLEDYSQPNFVYGDRAEKIVSEVVVW